MSQVNKKLLLKNTIFLYIRMIFIMLVSLYTVRAILDLLGVQDFGIYNVVGSIVGMFSFLNGTLATSSQRFFSVALAKNNPDELNKYFCLNLTVFVLFVIILLVIAETVGLWFLNTQLTIPVERMLAANTVYQFSIIACAISIFKVPYTALVIAHEKMGAFAYIGIYEAIFKLIIVLVLSFITWDKLIIYGILMFISTVSVSWLYYWYSKRTFEVANFHLLWDKVEIINLFSFSGWHFLGTISNIVRGQCINILLNIFFNPAINAARAIAYQVNGAVVQFTENFCVAVKPQLYKSYSAGEFRNLYRLINQSTILATYLSAIIAIPLMINSEYVLKLWLKEVPTLSVQFTNIVLITGLIESTNTAAIVPALATGNIKKFEIVIASIAIANLPVSYIFLKLGAPAYVTMVIATCLAFVTMIWRAFLLKDLINLPYKEYLIVLTKLTIATTASIFLSFLITWNNTTNFEMLVGSSLASVVITSTLYFFIVLGKKEKNVIIDYILKFKTKIPKK